MQIPNCVKMSVRNEPLQNTYWTKAEQALSKLKQITPEMYFDDYVSVSINTLERFYKGFLQSAKDFDEEYMLPVSDFLTRDHDLLALLTEIRDNYPDAVPRYSKSDWYEIKNFLRDLRRYYTDSKYTKDFTFDEFSNILAFVESQMKMLKKYVQDYNFEPYTEPEIPIDM